VRIGVTERRHQFNRKETSVRKRFGSSNLVSRAFPLSLENEAEE